MKKSLQAQESHSGSVSAPYPGTAHPENGVQDRLLTILLHQLDNMWVSAGVKEETCHCFSVTVQGWYHGVEEVGMGGQHVEYVVECGGQVELECCALTRQQVSHINWLQTTARQATGTWLLCPVPSQPAQHLSHPGSRKDKSARQWENEGHICLSINWVTYHPTLPNNYVSLHF